MNEFKYKDLDYAKNIIEHGFSKKYFNTEIKLVALYLRDILDIRKKEDRKNELHNICKKYIKDYHRMRYYKVVNKAIDYSTCKKNQLITIESVPVLKCEVNYFNSAELTLDEKKLLFTLLIVYKLNKEYFEIKKPDEPYDNIYFKGGTSRYSDLKKISNISSKVDINIDLISKLAKRGYLQLYNRGCIRMNFMEQIDYNGGTGEIAFEITYYNNIGHWFEWYTGNKRIGKCNKCGNVFYKKVNNQIYCDKCQGYEKQNVKTIVCCDCGREFEINSLSRKLRCPTCNKLERSRINAQYRKTHKKD